MLSFYPGPSKLRPEMGAYMNDAIKSGILSYNHRSQEFVQWVTKAVTILKEKLNVPDEYEVYFLNSATECWQTISSSLVSTCVVHYYNGSFGQRWMEVSKLLGLQTINLSFDCNTSLPVARFEKNDLICVTNCETSNGSYIDSNTMALLRLANPENIIAVDATSCMAGISLDFALADVWFASVQKCFGLPAGLAVMICSPQGVEKAKQLKKLAFHNNLIKLHTNMLSFQTVNTPNMLGIYLLAKSMNYAPPIAAECLVTKSKAKQLRQYFKDQLRYKTLIHDDHLASPTVLTIQGDGDAIARIKEDAKVKGFLLGNGYGLWAKDTFRIANFPAHTAEDVDALILFFKTHL